MAITIDGTNGLTSDNAALKLDGTTLVVDDTNNRVGVGTASPVVAMDVVGQVRASTGILFGSDTAAANALDDYEEGTWNVTVVGSTSGEASYTTRTAKYTKIGNQVSVVAYLQIDKNTLNGVLRYSLPFTVANVSSGYTGVNINYWDDLSISVVGLWAYASSNQSTFEIRYNTAAAGNSNPQLTATHINNGHELMFTATYYTS